MHQEILRDSWVYQEIGQEFLEQGFEKGLVQGLEKGREQIIRGHRQVILSFVQAYFPEIIDQVRQQVENINDPELLQALTLKLVAAQELDEAKKILFEADKH